ncbi:hypothetical protein LPJ78_002113 [Coemansia sp. RSA 989]|nr:E1-E2 ATPase-domain-containing protein [Coemansia mojavensis]KAJ1741671.1 hypothetical protein LPJ68_002636 [Coemansia sp. RSA 1086]KAJ1866114.1 hypothetical protein LPJ78_002113 [Coemansia sp. RSA 989]KAJ1875986.1 hypothetical protein LPJ55_000166 [Coemansia sp. RSA 990]KAJ2674113.1 hypothetical protein IWW42_001933 [Coemansia sp. RSA 1085]
MTLLLAPCSTRLWTLRQAVVTFLILVSVVSAKQLWNEVNKYDANGNLCPAKRSTEECPAICVYDLSNCPQPISCPDSQVLCHDGNCHDKCTDEINSANPCFCGWKPKHVPSQAETLVPCPVVGSITIDKLYLWNKTDQVRDVCANDAGVSNHDDYGIWGKTWPRHSSDSSGVLGVWTECPDEPQEMYTFREPMWIAVFSVLFGFVGLLGLWYAFKQLMQFLWKKRAGSASGKHLAADAISENSSSSIKEKSAAAAAQDSSGISEKSGNSSKAASSTENDFDSNDIRLSGYRNNIFGTLMTWYLLLLSMAWLSYLFILSADYYGSMPNTPSGKDSSLAYNDSVLLTQTFIFMWCLFVFMIVTITVFRFRLRNFFRIKTPPGMGDFVCVEHKIKKSLVLAEQSGFLVKNVQRLTDALKHALRWDWEVTTCPLLQTASKRKYFTYQCTRFVYDEDSKQFAPYSFDLGNQNDELVAKSGGLTTEEAGTRFELIGPNSIEVYVPNWFWATVREMSSFIFLYQGLALIMFMFDLYYRVGCVDLGIILLAVAFSVIVRKRSEDRLKRMAEYCEPVMVKRDDIWAEVSSRELVPGDVIQIKSGMHLSCDCILISGNAVMNQSSLTGESRPVPKHPLRIDDTRFSENANKSNYLFAGTLVSQVQPMLSSSGDYLADENVLCLVNRTGTSSERGKLLRTILYPEPVSFIFDEQLKVVFGILFIYVLFCMALAIYFYQGSPTATYLYFMFCAFQAISPLLPAGLLAGQSMAVYRMKRKQIYCVDPKRVFLAAKTKFFCFDKTGTLTKEGLEFYGVQKAHVPAAHTEAVFDEFTSDLASSDEIMQMGMATCHAVTNLNGEPIGNPVDIEQWLATQCTLEKGEFLDKIMPPEGSKLDILNIVRRFEFVHARASMSVVVQDERTGKLHVFVKGSFERLKDISNAPSVPGDYDQVCSRLAREGCYVLAFAHKVFDVSLDELRNMAQEEIEADCDLVGLLVFKNLLKHDTPEAMGQLKDGSIRPVMVTGDNAMTGVYIARQCGMVPPDNSVLLGDVNSKTQQIVWTDVDTNEQVTDVQPYLNNNGPDGFPLTELAVTSAAFRFLDEQGEMAKLLLNTRIFARMKPNDKVRCVQLHMEKGITAMCGDGGNDTAALRAAHAGLALSSAEAAIVSPFSTSNPSILSCVELLIQCRAGLASSFANYRALIGYGTVMTLSNKIMSFYFSSSLSDITWLLIDALIATSMAITVTFLPAAKKLAKYRPTAQILGPEILASTMGVVVINFCFIACMWVWLFKQSFFRCNEFDSSNVDVQRWYLLGDNFEAAAQTYVVFFQFINNGLMVNYGFLHRRNFFYNPALLAVAAMLIIIISYVQLAPPSRLSCSMRLNCGDPDVLESLNFPRPTWYIEPYNSPIGHNVLPDYAKWTLWGYSIGNMVAGHVWQVVFVYGPVRNYLRRRFPQRRIKFKL